VTDTPPEVEERYRLKLLALSSAERLRMACRMFTTGRTLMKASFVTRDAAEQRQEMFVRLYGDLFTDHECEAILQGIRRG